VIVPNYNHEKYLHKRLDSIFSQKYRDFEVILLDDCSTDGSVDILKSYLDFPDVRLVENQSNSGSPFTQWLKGLSLSQGNYWWIAESDDFSEYNFLEALLPLFQHQDVQLAYANSSIVDENDKFCGDYTEGEYLGALSKTKWKSSYTVSAAREINDGLGVKNTILNVSSAIFRKFELNDRVKEKLLSMRIAGDWLFIISSIRSGSLSYDCRKLNYHRRHSESVIGSTVANKKIKSFFEEISVVHEEILNEFELNKGFCNMWDSYINRQYIDFTNDTLLKSIESYYPYKRNKEKIKTKAYAELNL
jgi:glycosyltransferase involved in cell wall biosynthesis